MHLRRSPSNVPGLQALSKLLQNPPSLLTFEKVQDPLCLPIATRNDIWTSKSAPNPSVFNTFDIEMCFAPQRRVHHLNFPNWSKHVVCVCTYWLRNVLRATTECTFSTSQLPKVLRCWGVLYMLTSKCASCHNGMQFFTPHLPRWLRTRRFNKPTFRPSGATNHWKNIVFRDFSTFLRTCVFFLLTLSLLWSSYFSFLLWFFPPLLFISPYCRKMSEAWLLNFLR